MEKQLTAVEWLVEELTKQNMFMHLFAKEIEQAKQMEKEQKEKDFIKGYKAKSLASNLIFDEKSEYYAKSLFNRTFKSE